MCIDHHSLRQVAPEEIPVPCIPPNSGSRVLQRLELEPFSGESDLMAILEKAHAISGDEMGHRRSFPDVAMQPEPPIHGEDHPVAA